MSLYKIQNTKYKIQKVLFITTVFILSLFFIRDVHAGFISRGPVYLGLNSGLVGCWTFDGAYTQAPDCSGNNNNGTLTGGPTKTIGKLGQALVFDGSNDRVTILDDPEFTLSNGFSLSAWIKADVISGSSRYIVTQWGGGGVGVASWAMFLTSAGALSVSTYDGIGSGVTITDSTTNLQLGRWYHVLVTYTGGTSGTNGFIYLDGNLNFSGTLTKVPQDSSSCDVQIGVSESSTCTGLFTGYFDGLIDDVRVYNRALSAEEIARLYRIGFGSTQGTAGLTKWSVNVSKRDVLTQGLVGYWTFDGADIGLSGIQAKDRSGNNNHGTLTNGPVRAIGRIGQALDFDGVDDFVDAGDITAIDDATELTGCAWVRPDTSTTDDAITNKRNGVGFVFFRDDVGLESGRLDTWSISIIDTNLDEGRVEGIQNSANERRWYHVCFTFVSGSSTGLRLYIDGVEDANSPDDTSLVGSINAGATSFLIGDWPGGTMEFDGSIDEVRIYDRVLSADEVRKLYEMGR